MTVVLNTFSRREQPPRRRRVSAPPSQVVISVSGGIMAQAKMLAQSTSRTSPLAVDAVQAKMRSPGGVAAFGRPAAQAKMQAPGGVSVSGRPMAQAKMQSPGGVVVFGRPMTQSKAQASTTSVTRPPGIVAAQAKMRAPGGVSARSVITNQVKLLTTIRMSVSATCSARVMAPGLGYVVRIVPSPKLPLFLLTDDTGSSFWPGRS